MAEFDCFLTQHCSWHPGMNRPLDEVTFCNYMAHHYTLHHQPGTTLSAIAGIVDSLAQMGTPDPRAKWPTRARYDMAVKGYQRAAGNQPLALAHGLQPLQPNQSASTRTPTQPLTPPIWRAIALHFTNDTSADTIATLAIMVTTMASSARLSELLPSKQSGYPAEQQLKEILWSDLQMLPDGLGIGICIKMKKTDQSGKGSTAVVAKVDSLGPACPYATLQKYLHLTHTAPQPADVVFIHPQTRVRLTARWYTTRAKSMAVTLGIPPEAVRGHSGHAGMSQAMRTAGFTEQSINTACGWTSNSRVALTTYAQQDVVQAVDMQRAAHQVQYTFQPVKSEPMTPQPPPMG